MNQGKIRRQRKRQIERRGRRTGCTRDRQTGRNKEASEMKGALHSLQSLDWPLTCHTSQSPHKRSPTNSIIECCVGHRRPGPYSTLIALVKTPALKTMVDVCLGTSEG